MADVYEIITARIISQLESGTVPWHKPWSIGTHGGPQNLVSKKEYRGVNVFLLSCMPYTMPYWVSYKQAQQLGGNVRKGEKSTPVVFWKWLEKENPETGKAEKIPLLRYYRVFNVSQCEGIDGKIPQIDELEAGGGYPRPPMWVSCASLLPSTSLNARSAALLRRCSRALSLFFQRCFDVVSVLFLWCCGRNTFEKLSKYS